MPRRDAPEFSYDENTKLYRKKIKNPEGRWVPVYGKTKPELREKVRLREEAFASRAAEIGSPLVFQYAKTWYELNTVGLSEKRRWDYRNAINNHILPEIGQTRLVDVKHDDIMRVMAHISHLSHSSQVKAVSAMKQIFDAAERNGMIIKSPCRDIKAGGEKSKPKSALTIGQQKVFEEAVKGTSAYVFSMIGLYSGLRREEILGLQWDCVELDGSAPHIMVKRALRWKNSQPVVTDTLKSAAARRDIPIPPQLVECLKLEKAEGKGDYVVCNSKGGPMSNASYKSLWLCVKNRQTGPVTRRRKDGDVEVEKKLGETSRNHKVEYAINFHVTPHLLRHTYVSRLILSGVDVKTVQYLAGHATIAMTLDIYTHLMENKPQDLIGKISVAFAE